MLRRETIAAIAVGMAMTVAHASGPSRDVSYAMPEARLIGTADFNWLFWDLFDASLWSADGLFSWDRPFALSLTYRTDFSGGELTQSTVEELERVTDWSDSDLAAFRNRIASCMADVQAGDRFTAMGPDPDTVVLYLNSEERCQLSGTGLRRDYFGIWLSKKSRFPMKSRELTGRSS